MLNKFRNEDSSVLDDLKAKPDNSNNIFIFSLSYEERSVAIYEKFILNKNMNNICFFLQEPHRPEIKDNKQNIKNEVKRFLPVGYDEHDIFLETVAQEIKELQKQFEGLNIHFDYSSMPRSWYCPLPKEMNDLLRRNDKAYFWYSEGDYGTKAEFWPSAGINDIYKFSGTPSLRPVNNRSHILGLGFDNLRSQAICSTLDPNYLVISYSYPKYYNTMRDVLLKNNRYMIDTAAYSIVLPTDDFIFSISKLIETVKELLVKGDVVLVPDGPKPQILASSLIPDLLKMTGIVCMHVKRHDACYKPIKVKAKGGIFGFSFSQK